MDRVEVVLRDQNSYHANTPESPLGTIRSIEHAKFEFTLRKEKLRQAVEFQALPGHRIEA